VFPQPVKPNGLNCFIAGDEPPAYRTDEHILSRLSGGYLGSWEASQPPPRERTRATLETNWRV